MMLSKILPHQTLFAVRFFRTTKNIKTCPCGSKALSTDFLDEKIWKKEDHYCSYLRYSQNKTAECWSGECALYRKIQGSAQTPLQIVLSYMNAYRLQDYISDYFRQLTILEHEINEQIEQEKSTLAVDKLFDRERSYRVVALHLSHLVKMNSFSNHEVGQIKRDKKDVQLLQNYRGEKQTIFIYNHALTVSTPEKAWESIHAVWKKLRPGDYLVFKELSSDLMEKRGWQKYSTRDGIIEFHRDHRSFRTTISTSFGSYFPNHFPDVCQIFEINRTSNPEIQEKSKGTHFSAF